MSAKRDFNFVVAHLVIELFSCVGLLIFVNFIPELYVISHYVHLFEG